jgi:hypothetical protein
VLLTLGAALVAVLCVGASARRLAWAVAPIDLDPRMLAKALGAALEHGQGDALRRALGMLMEPPGDGQPDGRPPVGARRFAWERDLFAALDEADRRQREALINEQLLDVEARAARWSRVPRVCASIGTSAGLLFGSLALLQGLGAPAGDGGAAATHEALSSALGALSLGIAATSFCVAVHVRAARVARERRQAIDNLVTVLERIPERTP